MRSYQRAAVVVLFLGLASGCSPECGPITATRCDGLEAQICSADLRWQTFATCDEAGVGWVCAEVPGGAACLPGAEVDAAGRDGGAL